MPWMDFVMAKLMIRSKDPQDWTVAMGLFNLVQRTLVGDYFSVFCAGGIIVAIPISILFILMQKFYVEGITVKGINALRRGITIEDYKTSPAEVEILSAEKGETVIKIIIHEGKNRQVRKMMEAVGCKVTGLKRTGIGDIVLGNLPLGRWRYLTSHEISRLKSGK